MRIFLSALALGACSLLLRGQTTPAVPLNERVMVVYNADSDYSRKVAKYYMDKRNIPRENLCKIDTEQGDLEDQSRYEPEVRKPVRACLEKLGKQHILYIVFSFQTPFATNYRGNRWSIDQLVADIWDEYAGPGKTGREVGDQPYFGRAESEGNVYDSYVPFAKYREQPNAKTIYSVWRLEGATAEAAESLVDKALYAESHGLHGKTYFDMRRPIAGVADQGYGAGEWDIYQASQMTKKAGFDVTLDDKDTEFGTAPSQLRCENAALYAGWYSLAHYNDAFSWAPGAIGFHLDSASALNPRTGVSWVAGALQRGITVTSGSVTEPFLEGLVHPDQIFLYLFQGANVGDAVVRGTRWLKWMILNVGDPLYRPFPNGVGDFAGGPKRESWFGVFPTTLVGGGRVRGQFQLVEKRDRTLPVLFNATYAPLVTLPTNVSLPPEATGAQFEIAIKPPSETLSIVVTITVGKETLTNTVNMFPILADLSLSQPNLKSDGTMTGTVSTLIPAKDPGFTVKLSSNQPGVVLPQEINIPPGARKATFPISSKAVTAEVTATITATFDSAAKSAQLKITP